MTNNVFVIYTPVCKQDASAHDKFPVPKRQNYFNDLCTYCTTAALASRCRHLKSAITATGCVMLIMIMKTTSCYLLPVLSYYRHIKSASVRQLPATFYVIVKHDLLFSGILFHAVC
jgi:hypothetical protein